MLGANYYGSKQLMPGYGLAFIDMGNSYETVPARNLDPVGFHRIFHAVSGI